jgi:hypothetical protein
MSPRTSPFNDFTQLSTVPSDINLTCYHLQTGWTVRRRLLTALGKACTPIAPSSTRARAMPPDMYLPLFGREVSIMDPFSIPGHSRNEATVSMLHVYE